MAWMVSIDYQVTHARNGRWRPEPDVISEICLWGDHPLEEIARRIEELNTSIPEEWGISCRGPDRILRLYFAMEIPKEQLSEEIANIFVF
jgi:hypothetical protein